MRRAKRTVAVFAIGLAIGLPAPSVAQAHGPCRSVNAVGCLKPSSGRPGTRVTIVGTTAYRLVWNENVPYDSESHYLRGAPTVGLVDLSDVKGNIEFVVPRVAPGFYPVAIYDGAEGGAHYTWDLFRVAGPSSLWRTVGARLLLGALGLLAGILWLARGQIRSIFSGRDASPS